MEIILDKITLAHGSGGRLSHELVKRYLQPKLSNPLLDKMDDSAVLDFQGRLAFTTDSFVVNPIFFPGGDIGKLAICGTVNDLATSGARPLYLSLAFIIEEGFSLEEFEKVLDSIRITAEKAGVKIVTGDTKVVNHGSADKIFINTSGIGLIPAGVEVSGSNALPGDKVLINGTIGDHGMAVMSVREGLRLKIPVESDCAPLSNLTADMLQIPQAVHAMRDPTRGGLATTLNELASQSKVGIRIYEDNLPVKESVQSACEMLGLDPLYIANEGKIVAMVAPDQADSILKLMRNNQYGQESAVIGEVTEERPGRVVMKTRLGTSRIIDMLSGELLPRIC
jgi:hydrogenase expression/formation protein HypE